MLKISPIVKGEPKVIRATFFNGESDAPINTQGWTLFISVGASRKIEGADEFVGVPDAQQELDGQIAVTIPPEYTEHLKSSVYVSMAVDTGSGNKVPLMLAVANVQTADQYHTQYFQTNIKNSQLLKDTPTLIQQGAAQEQSIKLNIDAKLNPIFDVGLVVRFDNEHAVSVLLNRENHTNTQPIDTVLGLPEALQGLDDLSEQRALDARFMAVVEVESGNRTLTKDDVFKHLRYDGSNATFYIPKQSMIDWGAAVEIHIEQKGSGSVTVAPEEPGAVIIKTMTGLIPKTKAQHAVITVKRVEPDVWLISGELESA